MFLPCPPPSQFPPFGLSPFYSGIFLFLSYLLAHPPSGGRCWPPCCKASREKSYLSSHRWMGGYPRRTWPSAPIATPATSAGGGHPVGGSCAVGSSLSGTRRCVPTLRAHPVSLPLSPQHPHPHATEHTILYSPLLSVQSFPTCCASTPSPCSPPVLDPHNQPDCASPAISRQARKHLSLARSVLMVCPLGSLGIA